MEHVRERLRYQLITGPDDVEFCRRVSAALDEGYELHGSPSIAVSADQVVVAQAVILPPYATGMRPAPAATAAVGTLAPEGPGTERDETFLG
ncbi:MAG TPA: DUF1737 domain-containing protein [Mycobacteriales bacterium]|jgi:hypothetical protein|nr:DUF1737 domain-containing protein [Mycobacteriales bacterium]